MTHGDDHSGSAKELFSRRALLRCGGLASLGWALGRLTPTKITAQRHMIALYLSCKREWVVVIRVENNACTRDITLLILRIYS